MKNTPHTVLRKSARQFLVVVFLIAEAAGAFAQMEAGLPRPIMQFTPEQYPQFKQDYLSAPVISNPPLPGAEELPHSVNLLPHLDYVPVERDQGGCDDYWQWAATGAVEIEQDIRTGRHERLSVQFINSCSGACCVGGRSLWVCKFLYE